jgi:hypothetical protein
MTLERKNHGGETDRLRWAGLTLKLQEIERSFLFPPGRAAAGCAKTLGLGETGKGGPPPAGAVRPAPNPAKSPQAKPTRQLSHILRMEAHVAPIRCVWRTCTMIAFFLVFPRLIARLLPVASLPGQMLR